MMASEQFDRTPEQLKLADLRAQRRKQLKYYYQRETWNPHRQASGEQGVLFDPALQRWIAMKATETSRFKPNLYNAAVYFGGIVAPIVLYGWYLTCAKKKFEAKCRSGEIPYHLREFKFM